MNKYLIVGLGNPGKKYEKNRHNIGYVIAAALNFMMDLNSDELGESITSKEYNVVKYKLENDDELHIMFPLTFMNNSGNAVKKYTEKYNIDIKNMIVVYDAEEVKLGDHKIRESVSARGHNGIKSVINEIGSNDFKRVKVGIGECPEGLDMLTYVLSDFTDEEFHQIKPFSILNDILKLVKAKGQELS